MSKKVGQEGVDEKLARKSVSVYDYVALKSKAANISLYLQCETEEDLSTSAWPAEEDKLVENKVVIKDDKRYMY